MRLSAWDGWVMIEGGIDLMIAVTFLQLKKERPGQVARVSHRK